MVKLITARTDRPVMAETHHSETKPSSVSSTETVIYPNLAVV
jgi:hypothetical protein